MSIAESIGDFPNDGRFYLLEEITKQAGFFVVNGLPVYGVLATGGHGRAAPIRTALLEYDAGIDLLPIREGEETSVQTFNLIRMTAAPDQREIDAFFTLCRDHAKGGSRLSLRDFFFAASKLFRQQSVQGKKNAIGLFGELSVIDFGSSNGVDLSAGWQIVGTESKYDFTFDQLNIEVKTTTRHEMIPKIKHDQIFNEDNNVLCFCQIEKSPVGITLNELSQKLLDSENCFITLESRLVLTREILAIEDDDLLTPYKMVGINFYQCGSINPFLDIPDRVTSLSYGYDLTGLPVVDPSVVLASCCISMDK